MWQACPVMYKSITGINVLPLEVSVLQYLKAGQPHKSFLSPYTVILLAPFVLY